MSTPQRAVIQELLPGYELGDELGRGGWGVVFSGQHRTLRRPVAIKQLPEAFGSDPEVQSRFLEEARLVASLDHPHIVPVYDYVEQGGTCLLVMELLPGGTLRDRLEAGARADVVCAVIIATLSALHYAHQRGILHRDIKPENVMFTAEGTPKLGDFGIAKVLGEASATRTATGMVLGTPTYMAPEQASGQGLGSHTDVYATGAMTYELLAGRPPFPAAEAMVQLYRHVNEPPPPLRDAAPHVPPPLEPVVMQALAKDPGERHASAEAFGVALAEAATEAFGPGWLRRTDASVVTGGAIAAAAEVTPGVPAGGRELSPSVAVEIPRKGRRTLVIGAALLLVILAVGAVITLLDGGDGGVGASDTEILLRPAATAGDHPFTAPVTTEELRDDEPGGGGDAGGADADGVDEAEETLEDEVVQLQGVRGSQPELYRAIRGESPCDRSRLVSLLGDDPDRAEAWTGAFGDEVGDIEGYVDELTPLVLSTDARVTDHVYREGAAESRQAVLEAETAVLVGPQGLPRVRCASGSPLAPPEQVGSAVRFAGAGWEGFRADAARVVVEAEEELEAFVVADLHSGERFFRPVGTDGSSDADLPEEADGQGSS